MFALLFYLFLFSIAERPASPLTLTWLPPDGGPPFSGYYIYQKSEGQVWPKRMDAGTNTFLTVSNMTVGITYQFHATAYNQHGLESEPSNTFEWLASSRISPPVDLRRTP